MKQDIKPQIEKAYKVLALGGINKTYIIIVQVQLVKSYIILVQYQNQEIVIGIMCVYRSMPCYYLCRFVNHHCIQEMKLFYCQKDISILHLDVS